MAQFRFRLESSLRLAKQALDEARRQMADELRKQREIALLVERRRQAWEQAVAGQREAGRYRPLELGMWQVYTVHQLELLRDGEVKLQIQAAKVEEARSVVIAAHQETEKYQRLKAKLAAMFRMAEMKQEQAILDEVSQVIYWRQQKGPAEI